MKSIPVYDIEAEDIVKIAYDNELTIAEVVEMLMAYKDEMMRDNNLIVKTKITASKLESLVKANPHYLTHCPRCGKLITGYSALSRRADVEICSDCGTMEALADAHMLTKIQFEDWHIVKCSQC